MIFPQTTVTKLSTSDPVAKAKQSTVIQLSMALIRKMVIPDLCSRRIQVFYLFSFYLFMLVPHGGSVYFNFTFGKPYTWSNHINFSGNATYYDKADYISLTAELATFNMYNGKGRATYNQPVPLWDKGTREITNFTTRFSFIIKNTTPANFGDGLAFFLSSYPSQIPIYGGGSYIGLYNSTTAMNASANQVVAVEFDTYLNYDIDPNSTDQTDCHIGIDVNMIKSTAYQLIPNSLFVNERMTAQIEYNSWLKLLSLSLWNENNLTIQFNLSAPVDIQSQLPAIASVGFSAATGGYTEAHQIFWWSFNSTLEITNKKNINVSFVVGIAVGLFVMFLLVGILISYLRKRSSIKKIREIEVIDCESIDYEFEKGRGPKRFPYNELVDATNGFGEDKKLGEGGFGSVYRGILRGILQDESIHVAVKRVSKDSKQGKKEYISEVKIISQLRHRNLVQLIGWCHDYGEFLLVYELMHKGSLDKHLYSKETLLTWPIRHNIALGLGSALLYLHEEWEQCVVHRDIKPSNIMLDSSFNAKLGDFGLARLTDHNQEVETVAAGTKGYIAPECFFGTRNASTHSDVFSFGVVLLEIACGRRPIMPQQDESKVILVEWVWDLYGKNALMEAVDPRLNCELEKKEVKRLMVVGLWCAHPEKSSRPSIRQAMNVLHLQANLPILPPKMPMPVYTISLDPIMQFYTSSEATSSSVAENSTKSALAPSSDSSRPLLKQEPRTF